MYVMQTANKNGLAPTRDCALERDEFRISTYIGLDSTIKLLKTLFQ